MKIIGQDSAIQEIGEVSFITSNNVYVKFENTEYIQIGDTLVMQNTQLPCLIVNNKSSTSCVCISYTDCEIKKGDKVLFALEVKKQKQNVPAKVVVREDTTATNIEEADDLGYTEDIRGRISLSSYNTLFSDREDRHRLMTRFVLNASHINNSKFSFETYMNYRYNVIPENSELTADYSYFRVYNLALSYDVNPNFKLVLGRKINPRAWSLGAIDGLQGEYKIGKNYIGGVVGFRPDIFDYGVNTNLFQYAVYYGRTDNSEQVNSDLTIGFVEQRNGNFIDRRYVFFQYSSTFFRKLNVFTSLETDIYSRLNGEQNNEPRLTNLYLSAGYRFNRIVDLNVSYDSRKRIIFYETFQTEIERMLDDDFARQGVRARINIRPLNFLRLGFSYNKRFQSDLDNKSDNYYSYASLSKLPLIGGRLMFSFNLNSSNYVTNKSWTFRYSRNIIKSKLSGEVYLRLLNYKYINNETNLSQHYYGANLSYSITKKLRCSLSGEVSEFNSENNYRIYAKISQRFYSKKRPKIYAKN